METLWKSCSHGAFVSTITHEEMGVLAQDAFTQGRTEDRYADLPVGVSSRFPADFHQDKSLSSELSVLKLLHVYITMAMDHYSAWLLHTYRLQDGYSPLSSELSFEPEPRPDQILAVSVESEYKLHISVWLLSGC